MWSLWCVLLTAAPLLRAHVQPNCPSGWPRHRTLAKTTERLGAGGRGKMQPGKGIFASLTSKLVLPTFGDTRMPCRHPQLHIWKLQRYLLAGILVDGPCDKGEEKSRGTWCFALPQFSVVRSAIPSPSFLSLLCGSAALPFAREEGVRHRLGQWCMREPMSPDGQCLRVPGKLGDAIARPLSVILKWLWWLGRFPGDEKKANVTPVSEKGKKEDLGNAGQAHLSPLEGYGANLSGSHPQLYEGTRRWLGQPRISSFLSPPALSLKE